MNRLLHEGDHFLYRPRRSGHGIVLDPEPGNAAVRRVRAAQLQQHDVDGEPASRDQARQAGNIRRDHIARRVVKESPAGAGTAERGHRHLGMTGAAMPSLANTKKVSGAADLRKKSSTSN